MQKTDDPMSLRLGIDSIYITDGVRSSCFRRKWPTKPAGTPRSFSAIAAAKGAVVGCRKKKGVEVYLFARGLRCRGIRSESNHKHNAAIYTLYFIRVPAGFNHRGHRGH